MASPQPTDAELLAELVKQVGKLTEISERQEKRIEKLTRQNARIVQSDRSQNEIIRIGIIMLAAVLGINSGLTTSEKEDNNYFVEGGSMVAVLVTGVGDKLKGFVLGTKKEEDSDDDETED